MPNKNVAAFRAHNTIAELKESLQSEAFLIPKIVKDMGQLIGLQADALIAEWDETTYREELIDAYRELSTTTSQLLSWYSVEDISEEAIASVGHRLAQMVDPLVSLHARVDHLFRAYQQGESENVLADAHKLWAALNFRCEVITGLPFPVLLRSE